MPRRNHAGRLISVIVLFIGDIVGPRAAAWVAERLPLLRDAYDVDVVIANAENCAPSGTGTSAHSVDLLLSQGVDVVTGGNHSWEGDDADITLSYSQVLRPANASAALPGRGLVTIDAGGEDLTVLNIADVRALGPDARDGATPPYLSWLDADRRGTTIVDFHGDHVLEKQVFAYAVDGEAAAVLGTHSHEPTLPLHILPQGTGFVTDVGMTGPLHGVQGFDHRRFVAGLKLDGRYLAPPLPTPGAGPIAFGAVVLEIAGGRTTRMERVDERIAALPHRPPLAAGVPVPDR
jgi:metallophosphoesterase (TIGR00282 family)